ncbi:MAG: PqqD family protein [Burkholderiales bacterium]
MGRRYKKNPAIELAPLEHEAILFDPQTNKFMVLNRTSAFVWENLSEDRNVDDIAVAMCASFSGVGLPEARNDIEQILGEMASYGIIIGILDHSNLEKEATL